MYGMPVCETRYRVRDFNGLSSQDLGGGGGGGGGRNLLHYPGCGFMRGHRQMAWGGEPKWSKPIPCLAGGVFIIRNYQCTLV